MKNIMKTASLKHLMPHHPLSLLRENMAGITLCLGVSGAALLAESLENKLFGGRWLESLVLAILIGTAVSSLLHVPHKFRPGIHFCAKFVLEVAVVLLGASVSMAALQSAGGALVGGIMLVVLAAIGISYGLGRLFSLPPKLAILVACGNSICGNSAIAAAAPVIGAESEDIAASIAFTAALGVVVVLLLPFLAPLLHLSQTQYGVMAGMTVYAVPQVLAATAPVGAISVQLGTLVKLVRVLMLGPVIFMLGIIARRHTGGAPTGRRMPLGKMVPWFIIGFLAMMALRNAGIIPDAVLPPLKSASNALTILSMAALGLMVNVRSLAHASGRVVGVAALSLLALCLASLLLIHLLHLA